jgi:hypothetical protein
MKEMFSKRERLSEGARASARFTVLCDETLEIVGLFAFGTLKRRKRRAPQTT